jgi:hypothetical protein
LVVSGEELPGIVDCDADQVERVLNSFFRNINVQAEKENKWWIIIIYSF